MAVPRVELRALTSVRGFAAWFVVLYHVRESIAGLDGVPLAVLAKGYLAVDFFFLLSGFVIWMTWIDRVRQGGLAAVPGFLQRRVARIWPLHAVIMAGALALALLLAATGRPDDAQFPLAEWPLHLLLVQNWGLTDRLAWNDPAWSISAESAAYLLFPPLALAVDWRRLPSWAVIGAIAAILVALYVVMALGGAGSLNDDIPRFGVARCLAGFASGTAVAALWLRWRERGRVPSLVAAPTAMLLFAGYLAGLLPETLAMPACFAALLLVLARSRGTPLERPLPHWLGEISYATYLGHFLLWKVFKLLFVGAAGVGWPLIAFYLVLVLAASAVLYHGVERPAQRWINARRLAWPLTRPLRHLPSEAPRSPRG